MKLNEDKLNRSIATSYYADQLSLNKKVLQNIP